MTIGDRIKQAREEKGLSQEELARKMGYSGKTSISKIESAGNNVTTRTVTKFANALGVTEMRLMGWDIDEVSEKASIAADLYFGDANLDELIKIYKSLSDSDRQSLIQYANFLSHKQNS